VDLAGDLQRLYASAQPSAPSARPIDSTMIEFADGQIRKGLGAEELGEDRSPYMLMSTPVYCLKRKQSPAVHIGCERVRVDGSLAVKRLLRRETCFVSPRMDTLQGFQAQADPGGGLFPASIYGPTWSYPHRSAASAAPRLIIVNDALCPAPSSAECSMVHLSRPLILVPIPQR
jgi:hypothetical protein